MFRDPLIKVNESIYVYPNLRDKSSMYETFLRSVTTIMSTNNLGEMYWLGQSNYWTLLQEGDTQDEANPLGTQRICNFELRLSQPSFKVIPKLLSVFHNFDFPKGSYFTLSSNNERYEFGSLEGLALIFKRSEFEGSNLDVNNTIKILEKRLDGIGKVTEFFDWDASEEAAIYCCGQSFADMKDVLESCQIPESSRIVQFA